MAPKPALKTSSKSAIPSSESQSLRENLQSTMDEAEWTWFEPHLKRDSVILVSLSLDIVSVAEKIAEDDKVQVTEWIQQGLLAKPTALQIEAWKETPKKKFLSLIVQPYVLAQEYVLH